MSRKRLPPGETGDDRNDTIKIRYVVVDKEGSIVPRGRRSARSKYGLLVGDVSSLYRRLSSAQNQANQEGDSVVMVHVDLSREPVFIRTKIQLEE